MKVIPALLQVYILGAGLVLASLLTIPPWGIYRSPVILVFSLGSVSVLHVQYILMTGQGNLFLVPSL